MGIQHISFIFAPDWSLWSVIIDCCRFFLLVTIDCFWRSGGWDPGHDYPVLTVIHPFCLILLGGFLLVDYQNMLYVWQLACASKTRMSVSKNICKVYVFEECKCMTVWRVILHNTWIWHGSILTIQKRGRWTSQQRLVWSFNGGSLGVEGIDPQPYLNIHALTGIDLHI